MSASAWVRRYRDRPIAPQQRAAATLTVAVLVSACVAGLILTRSATPTLTHNSDRGFAGTQTQQHQPVGGMLSPAVERAVDGFLAGYLAYLYGRGPASQIKDATVSFARSLRAHPPRVPQGLDALKPRILRLLATRAPKGLLGVTAIVSDEEVVAYRIPLALTSTRGRFRVSGLDAG